MTKEIININAYNEIVDKTNNTIIKLIKLKNITNLDDYYDVRLNKKNIFSDIDIELSKLIYLFFSNKSTKILEIGGGICQLSILLNKLGYLHIFHNEINDNRLDCLNYLFKNLNITTSNIINKNIFDIDDIDKFDLLITNNIAWKRNNNIDRYNEFLFYKKYIYNGGILLYSRLCDTNYIDNQFKKCSDINIYLFSLYNIKVVYYKNNFKHNNLLNNNLLFYNTIHFSNIQDNLLNINNEKILQLTFKNNISYSAGVYILQFYILPNIDNTKLNRCKLVFDIKIDKINPESKIKVYTGIKWVIIDTELTHNFQTIELIDDFDFFKPSTYRIGFKDIENNILYIKNISININD